ncbi:Fic family protein [Streptomyces sp. NPDC059828]|uniref:Fic family protein n=1 Tax=Streptomyces sp. NPDC059828 TaxID=3346965 RepID=UPI0036510CC3
MSFNPTRPAVRRISPVVPPIDAEAIPVRARTAALDALAALSVAVGRHLGNPDLFQRPRFRTKVHSRYLDAAHGGREVERIAAAAEQRAAAGLAAVHSVRVERLEHPDRRPCFTPDALAELHRLLVHGDPSIPGGGGLRHAPAKVTWADGRCFAIDVAPGRPLRHHVERWHQWGTRTTSPALDAAALSMLCLFTIHPFPDGNGRTARLLAQCDLVAADLMPGLLLDLEGWTHHHRIEHDEAVVAAALGHWEVWGEVFARAVAETARQRITTVTEYGRLIDSAIHQAGGETVATAVLTCLRSSPAVSAQWLRGRIPYDPERALARLQAAGILSPHPRLPQAVVHPESLAVLETAYGTRPPQQSGY